MLKIHTEPNEEARGREEGVVIKEGGRQESEEDSGEVPFTNVTQLDGAGSGGHGDGGEEEEEEEEGNLPDEHVGEGQQMLTSGERSPNEMAKEGTGEIVVCEDPASPLTPKGCDQEISQRTNAEESPSEDVRLRKNDDSSEFTDSVQFQRKPAPASDKSEAEQAYASSPVTATSGLNQTHMVCLPKVAEKLRLVWKRAEHIQPLDGQTALVDAFNAFPYPTFQETSALALQCSLELEQVRVWFMMQRVRYGISWAEEDIQETRRKLQLLHAEEVEEEQLEEVTENWGIGLEEEDEDEEEEEMMRAFGASETMIRERRQAYAQASFGTFSLSSSQNQPRQPCLKQTPDQPHQSPAQPQPHCPPTQDIHQSVPTMQQGRVRSKKSKAQLMMLRRSFVRNNWPSDTEVQRLQATTGLGRHNIRKWFADSRYQLRRSGARWHDKHDLSSASLRSANSIPRSKDYKWRRTPKHLQGKSFSSSQWPGSSRPGAEIEVELNEEDGMMAMFNRTKEENSEVNVDGTYLSVNGHSTAFSSASSAIPSNSFLEKKKRKKTLEQTEILRRSFLKCQWPSPEQYQRLEQLTGLPRTQIIHWFGDTRYAVKHSRLRWINSDERQHIAAGLKQQQVDGGRQWGGRRQPPEALGSTPPYTNHGPASSISGGAEAGSSLDHSEELVNGPDFSNWCEPWELE